MYRHTLLVRKLSLLLVRAITLCNLALCGIHSILTNWYLLSEKTTTSDLITVVLYANNLVLFRTGIFSMWKHQTFLQRLFGKRERIYCIDECALIVWFVVKDAYKLSADTRKTDPEYMGILIMVGDWSFRHVLQVQYLSFILCLQGHAIVLKRLRLLDSKFFIWNQRKILADKQDIRELISGLNVAFSRLLAIMYPRIFLVFNIYSVKMIGSDFLKFSHLFSVIGCPFCDNALHYVV